MPEVAHWPVATLQRCPTAAGSWPQLALAGPGPVAGRCTRVQAPPGGEALANWRDRGAPFPFRPMPVRCPLYQPASTQFSDNTCNPHHHHHLPLPHSSQLHPAYPRPHTTSSLNNHPTPSRSHGPDQEGEPARYPARPLRPLLGGSAMVEAATAPLTAPQRMEALRVEADESGARAEEYKGKVKQLEGETTQKEQEITSLSHKNSVLESEVEKLEAQVKQFKDEAGAGAQAGTQAESLQRKIQVLEEEAEESDRTIRELNEKCAPPRTTSPLTRVHSLTATPQAPPDRRQVRPLRTQSPGSRAVPRPVGVQVRGDGQEIRRHQEGARRLCQGDR